MFYLLKMKVSPLRGKRSTSENEMVEEKPKKNNTQTHTIYS